MHKLTPGDIKVVAALGDSGTAAMGARAKTLLTNIIEYRGVSWSAGGDDDLSTCTTLPNIFKEYNPDLIGFSLDQGNENHANARLNVAISGSIAEDLPGQAWRLVDKINGHEYKDIINVEEDWKLISMWIGGNDLCEVCEGHERNTPENYIGYIQEALDILHKNLPKTFVNLVQTVDITRLAKLDSTLVCTIIHSFVCPCPTTGSDEDKEAVKEAAAQYQQNIWDLVNSGRYDTTDDFTVVVQPFFMGVDVPTKEGSDDPDMTYLAPDCFHFSTKGHKELAKALWDNMLEPVGSKSETWPDFGGPIHCPPEDNPFLPTAKNSGGKIHSESNAGAGAGAGAGRETETLDGNTGDKGGHSLIGIIVGSAVAAWVAVVAVVVVGVVWVRRRRRKARSTVPSNQNSDKHPLVTK